MQDSNKNKSKNSERNDHFCESKWKSDEWLGLRPPLRSAPTALTSEDFIFAINLPESWQRRLLLKSAHPIYISEFL